jgi:hypothetical protein
MAVSKRITMKQKIQELKEMGLSKTEIIRRFIKDNENPPSWPTVVKYYDMDEAESSQESPFAKDRVFDVEPYRTTIMEILKRNPKNLKISSIYDVLEEQYVDTKMVVHLPGNEQTLRNYVRWLRGTGQVPQPENKGRIYELVEGIPPGKQLIVDFGEQKIEDGITIHFMCMLLRFSKFLFVVAQDHKFNSAEACRGLYLCFKRIGGRVEELVIDQDSVFIYEEKYGEIIETQTFSAFLKEQTLSLFVCRKGDPESKGGIEKSVQFVKQNYFSARKLHTLQEARTGISSWLDRKNVRIERATYQIPVEQLKVEQQFLQPLVPSLYALVENDFVIYEVKDMPYVRYKANRYQVPRSYCFTSVKYKVINDIIHIYDISTGNKIIQHEIDKRKGITLKAPELKKEPSDAWKAIATSLRIKYYSKSLDHFINGVCKEHIRYRFEQLKAIERFLDSRKPIDKEFLEQVFAACCNQYAYSISGLESIFAWLENARHLNDVPMDPLETKPLSGVEVQQRGLESYAKAFRKLSTEHEGKQ